MVRYIVFITIVYLSVIQLLTMKEISDEELQKIIQRTALFDSVVRVGTGSKTNDKILRNSYRDLSLLIRQHRALHKGKLVRVVEDANTVLENVGSVINQLKLF